jgi:hypothetical protein
MAIENRSDVQHEGAPDWRATLNIFAHQRCRAAAAVKNADPNAGECQSVRMDNHQETALAASKTVRLAPFRAYAGIRALPPSLHSFQE